MNLILLGTEIFKNAEKRGGLHTINALIFSVGYQFFATTVREAIETVGGTGTVIDPYSPFRQTSLQSFSQEDVSRANVFVLITPHTSLRRMFTREAWDVLIERRLLFTDVFSGPIILYDSLAFSTNDYYL